MRLLWDDADEEDDAEDAPFSVAPADATSVDTEPRPSGIRFPPRSRFMDELRKYGVVRRLSPTEEERDKGKKGFFGAVAEAFKVPDTIEERFRKNPFEPVLSLPDVAVALPMRAVGEVLPAETKRSFLDDMRRTAISSSPTFTAAEQVGERSKLPFESFAIPALGFAGAVMAPGPGEGFKLPRALAGAKPRYGYGEKLFSLKFEDDLDRVLYILAQKKPSKADAAYLKVAMEHTGMDEPTLRKMGAEVRARIKALATEGDDMQDLVVPRGAPVARAERPVIEPPPRAPEPVDEPLPWDTVEPEVPRETPPAPKPRVPEPPVDEPPTAADDFLPDDGDPNMPSLDELLDPNAKIGFGDRFRPATEFIRRHGGLPGVAKDTAEKVARMFEDTVYTTARALNESVKKVTPAKKAYLALEPEKQREVWMAMELDVPLDNPKLEGLAQSFRDERKRQFDVLIEKGVVPSGTRPTPHVNPETGRIAALTQTDPAAARTAIRKQFETHWQEPRPIQSVNKSGQHVTTWRMWDEADVDNTFRSLQDFERQTVNPSGRRVLLSPNIKLPRTFNLPGWFGDPFSPEFSGKKALEGWDLYTTQWARAVGDAEHFGPEAEKLMGKSTVILDPETQKPIIDAATGYPKKETIKGLLDESKNPEFNKNVLRHREHFVGGTRDASDQWLATIRQIETGNKLGGAAIPNAFQTFVTTAPATASVVGLRESWDTLGQALKLVRSDPDFAKDIGALSEQLMLENASLGEAMRGGIGGLASKGAEGTLKLTQFERLEQFNRAFAAAAGRVHLQKLGEIIQRGDARSALAESEIRKILGNRDIADELIQGAKNGDSLLARTDATDRFAYEFAHRTQFSSNPNDLPIWVSTPLGKTFFQFKNFAYNYSRFLKTDVIDNLAKGNRGPAEAWLLGAGLSGAAITNIREALKPNMEKREWQTNPLEWYAGGGGFGLATDFARDLAEGSKATPYGVTRAVGAAFGPTVSDALSILWQQAEHQGGLVGEVAERITPNPFRLPRALIEKGEQVSPIPPVGFGSPEGASFNVLGGTARERRRSPFFLDVTRDLDLSLPEWDFTGEPETVPSDSGGGMELEW